MNGKRRISVGVLCLALLLVGCGPKEVEPTPTSTPEPTPSPTAEPRAEEFVLPYSHAGGFHPITGSNRINLTLAPLLYEGLFEVDNTFTAQLELCSGYSVSEDGLTWTFRLREAAFSDGSPLTGAEAAASLNTARQSQRFQARLKDVTRVTAGEGEVTVTLSRPNGDLPSLLDVPIVKETEEPQRPLGTGAYFLEEGGEGLVLRAREAQAPLETISLRPIAAEDDLVYAFDAREISLVNVDLTGTNALGYSGRYETTDYSTTTLLYVGYNLHSEACREEAVRRALSLALDRQEASTGSINIRWSENPVEVLERGEEFCRCRHLETGRELDVLTEFLRRDEAGVWCEDSTDYRLPVSPGDTLSLVRTTSRGLLCKKDGVTGWYFGRVAEEN